MKADDLKKSLDGVGVTLDGDAAVGQGGRRRDQLKHQIVERPDVHRHHYIGVRCLALAGAEASVANTDFEDEIVNADLIGLGNSGGGVRIENSAHRHKVGARDHDIGLSWCAKKASAPATERHEGRFQGLPSFRQQVHR